MFLGGRVSLDTIYLQTSNGGSGGNNSNNQFFNANNIPIDQEGENSELTLTARNSKFWVKTRTAQVNDKPLQTLLEVDFWGSSGNEKNSNSHNLRLPHAYIHNFLHKYFYIEKPKYRTFLYENQLFFQKLRL